MSAGVTDQRMKGQGNQVTNGPKEHVNEHEDFDSWRAQQHQGYTTGISTTMASADPYLPNYYGTSYQYQTAFGVSDGTWSTGSDPITFLGGYGGQIQHDSYGMEGMFGGGFGLAGGHHTDFNYFPGNGDYSTWGSSPAPAAPQPAAPPPSLSRKPHYEDYYRHPSADPIYTGGEGMKTIEHGIQSLGLAETGGGGSSKSEQLKEAKELQTQQQQQQPKKMTWATIASQPAKPQPQPSAGGIKKKGPGMPPGPMVPGKHNMDIGTWGGGGGGDMKGGGGGGGGGAVKSGSQTSGGGGGAPGGGGGQQQGGGGSWTSRGVPPSAPPPPAYLRHPPPPPLILSPPPPHPHLPLHHPHEDKINHLNSLKQKSPMSGTPQGLVHAGQQQQQVAPPVSQHQHQQQIQQHQPPPQQPQPQSSIPSHPILDELRTKNNYNPVDFDLSAVGARFFVIKSYSEDDIHRSIKYEIWCSTEHGNKRLDQAFRDQESKGGFVYLFFSVNGSGHFCGMAKMTSPVDYNASSSVWCQDKWKGQFRVRWIYVKDVPNVQLKHIRLENNENKPVTNSRDTQEVPFERGKQVLKVIHSYRHTTSIFDDFIHYERRQEEEDLKKEAESAVAHHSSHHKERGGGEGGRSGRGGGRGGRSNPH